MLVQRCRDRNNSNMKITTAAYMDVGLYLEFHRILYGNRVWRTFFGRMEKALQHGIAGGKQFHFHIASRSGLYWETMKQSMRLFRDLDAMKKSWVHSRH